ncbi:MAG: hypothetical protein LKE54_03585 [Prevotella sp.]|jgi:hypothetical protein|nr:hypothetical protein [Prevotella sp.]MCH3994128.1 hypothetical protein [Prevotella sp.]
MKNKALGISSHYEALPFGTKNIFVRQIAEALEMSTDNVRRRISENKWKEHEIQVLKDAGII